VNLCKVLELALWGGKDPRTQTQFTETKMPQNSEELIEMFIFHLQITVKNW
jgi:pyruvate-formate lyase